MILMVISDPKVWLDYEFEYLQLKNFSVFKGLGLEGETGAFLLLSLGLYLYIYNIRKL